VKNSLKFSVSLAIALGGASAQASLGDTAASIESDRRAITAVSSAARSQRGGFTVQELQSDSGTVREYISSTGVIFAIAWSGLRHPDLRVLLGSYFPDYQAAERAGPRRHGRRPRVLRGSAVVVETWGHMRKLGGRAYAASLLPAGVSAHEIL
jgi:hypothetical protein